MKHIFFFLLVLLFASCSKDVAPDPIQDTWETLQGQYPHIEYSFAVDGQMCETVDDTKPYCGMRWHENGANRYAIYRNDSLEGMWYVEFLGYQVCRVNVIPATPGEPSSVFYLERI